MNRKFTLIIVSCFIIVAGWLVVEFIFNPYLTPECNVEAVTQIASDIEWGISHVMMYGNASDFQDFVDASLLKDTSQGYDKTQQDCQQCTQFYKTINKNIKNVQIARCSPKRVVYWARIESATVTIDKETGLIEVPCFGGAIEGWYSVTKHNKIWRKSNVEPWRSIFYPQSPIDTGTSVEILRQNVCS